jgi:predicted amidohydrolase YtcJ
MQRPVRFPKIALVLVTLACAACSEPPAEPSDARTADLVLRNGSVYTVDAARTWAEAVGISNGRIVFVGTDADAESLIGPSTQVGDHDGRKFLPGLPGVHNNPHSGGNAAETSDHKRRKNR